MGKIRDHYNVSALYSFTVEVLKKANYSEESAQATAFALLEADKRGIFSHGIAGGTGLEEAVKRVGITATVNPVAEPIILKQKYPSIAVINANGAPGHITSMMAVNKVKALGRSQGLARVYVNNANHFGAAGVWSAKIAENFDMIGIVSCTTIACARPMGDDPEGLDYTKGAGTEVRVGTNPIAISVPHEEGIMTLDMALTRMAISYGIKALKAGKKLTIPEYIADKDYNSTFDPLDLFDPKGGDLKGSLFPHGSTYSGYKGDIQLRMIEVIHSLGGGPIKKVPIAKTDKRRRISHIFEAQMIDFLYSKEDAVQRVRELMKDYEIKYFGPSSRWPGDRANEAIKYSLKEGIPYSEDQIETLKRSAAYVGLDFHTMIQSIGKKHYPEQVFKK
ncbi:MAG: Ldh family oxidoreductase [Promethearchaeota archaeon]